MSGPRGHVRRQADLDDAVLWLCIACAAAGAVGGCFVGWEWGRDEATEATGTSELVLASGVGLLVGLVVGLAVGIGAVLVLVALDGRAWASASPLRAVLAAAGAAAPLTSLLFLLSGLEVSPSTLTFALTVSALPAALATLAVDRRAATRGRAARRR